MENAEAITVRTAVPEDLDGIMALALAACEENGVQDHDPVKLLEEIWPSLHQQDGICGVIGPIGGDLEGVVLLRVGPMWYSVSKIIEEKAVFVHPDFRNAKGGRARRLCEFSKNISDTLNIPLVIGVLSSERTAAKIRLYTRMFGEQAGAFFMYGAKTGEHPGLVP